MKLQPEAGVSDAELERTLKSAVARHSGREPRFVEVSRRPALYQSSFMLEELDVISDDGTLLQLMFKVFDRDKMLPEARALKPALLYDPRREIFVYRHILDEHNLGAPKLYAAVADSEHNRYWLFTERVNADVLWQIGEFETWKAVARWLGKMHRVFSENAVLLSSKVPLLSYTRPFLETWMDHAQQHLRQLNLGGDSDVPLLAEQYTKAVNRILELPKTFLHGEFYPSNILVAEGSGALRVCPIDWELAAIGPGLMDLAALTAGTWDENDRKTVVKEYLSSGPCEFTGDLERVQKDLDYCRLYIAVYWLAVFGDREPYWKHKHDWLGEAFNLASKMASSGIH